MKASKDKIKTISRLSAQAVFDSLRQTKELRWVATGLVVQALPRPESDPGPYGLCISASKKTAARATDRNRMRRRLKAVVLDVLPIAARPGMNYLISCRQQTKTRSVADLENDLRWCLKKMNLLKTEAAPDEAR